MTSFVASTQRVKDRSAFILDLLDRQGTASYEALAEQLQVSTMTIRRDCEELVRTGKIIKTVGGVQRAHASPYLYESHIRARVAVNRREKGAIAANALELIQEDNTIFIDGGTTNLALAKLIADQRTGLTILTNSAMICLELGKGQNSVIGIGGEFDPATLSFVGLHAEEMAKSFFVEQAFLTTKGFLPNDGTYESAVANFRVKQIIAGRAAETILLADHTKFGQRALSKVLDISQIQQIVTDEGTPEAELAILRQAGINVSVANLASVDYQQDASNTNQ
jgi:DeoR/GlpR family transcriptional regulator of sugar metabolism